MCNYTFYIQLILLLGWGRQRERSIKKTFWPFIGDEAIRYLKMS